MKPAENSEVQKSTKDRTSFAPRRVLDLRESALYVGLHWQTLRGLVVRGDIPRVCYPTLDVKRKLSHDSIRKILLDIRDLDSFIEKWKTPQPDAIK
jgi:hypothetical protein